MLWHYLQDYYTKTTLYFIINSTSIFFSPQSQIQMFAELIEHAMPLPLIIRTWVTLEVTACNVLHNHEKSNNETLSNQ